MTFRIFAAFFQIVARDILLNALGSVAARITAFINSRKTKLTEHEPLLSLNTKNKETDQDNYSSYESETESVEKVEKNTNGLYAYANFYDCHYDLTAQPLCEIASYKYPQE